MHKTIIDNWNNVVNTNDTVVILGDLTLENPRHYINIINTLKGRKILIPGNHDKCWPGHKVVRPADIKMYTESGLEIYPDCIDLNYKIQLCHFPFVGDSKEIDRYNKHRPVPRHENDWVLHGHVHEKWKVDTYNKQINVGVDVWNFTPVSINTIYEQVS